MGYSNLAQCLNDLQKKGELLHIDEEVDPCLEIGVIQRRVFQAKGPALVFNNVKGTSFPMAANIFGTLQRTRYIFRDSLKRVQSLLELKADPFELLKHPLRHAGTSKALYHVLPQKVKSGPIKEKETSISRLPQLKSWPQDGGSYITLPQVYTESPSQPGFKNSNLGMYRIQLSGNQYQTDREIGLHYQIHRGIGYHHAQALKKGTELKVNVFVGGPPALTLAAIMPLPEGIPEVYFAGLLCGERIPFLKAENNLPVPAQADFCICGTLMDKQLPEGPFGDHLGYYSLTHDFPVLRVDKVLHRPQAIWPFTTVGRPPQEDTVFGSFIHELTAPLVSSVFSGIHEVHAVDAAGVHPLLLAVGSERYVPYSEERIPQELLTCALSLLGNTQTSLSKYLLIAAKEDDNQLKASNIPEFFQHLLKRVDFKRDLHFLTRTTMDTLDYSGISLNQGSKVIIAAAGQQKRALASEFPIDLYLPAEFGPAHLFAPGILLVQGPAHKHSRDSQDPVIEDFCQRLSMQKSISVDDYPLLVIVDDSSFASANWDNFLWVVFTRSDPATDIYGLGSFIHCKHWGCSGALVIDARLKTYHAPPLEADPEVEKRVDKLGAKGGPLHKII
jgi:4-hydroxy-3-polyprenylbenzoate decarboxylase